jgi:phosphoglycerate dehydrogenase-like enzyme
LRRAIFAGERWLCQEARNRVREVMAGEKTMRIAFIDDFDEAYEGTPGLDRLRKFAEVEIFTRPVARSELRGFDGLVATRERTHFTAEFFDQLPDLKIVAQTGNHAYHIDLPAAEARGIVVAKAIGGFCTAAGELTFGLMMAVMRHIPLVDTAMKAGEWKAPLGYTLRGKSLGIVGLGNIGGYVAGIAQAFGMDVLAWSNSLTEERAASAVLRRCELDELMAGADIISIHATLSERSRGLIDRRRIGLLKPSAYLINTSRGAIIDEMALYEALLEKRIAGAGLDVFEQEPLRSDHPLRQLSNVVLTSHIGWPTDEMYAKFTESACEIFGAFLNGGDIPLFRSEFSLSAR